MNNELIETLIIARMQQWGDLVNVSGFFKYIKNTEFAEKNYYVKKLEYINFNPKENDLKRVALDNRNFKTPSDGLWYRLTIQHGVNLMVGMANVPCTRELGAVVIQIFYPNNANTRTAKQIADSLGNHFKYYRIDKLELMTPSVINVPQREDGYQINVRIPFRYN